MKSILWLFLPVYLFSNAVYSEGESSKSINIEKRQENFLSHLKNIKAGPLIFDTGGQLRLRYEYYDNYTILGYQPGNSDQLLLERIRLDFSVLFWNRPKLFLQLQDAHAFLTKISDENFPKSNPLEDTLDIRQLYIEWSHIAGTPLGLKIGRQQISYGDQRVFGPGNFGNTGRYAWDAGMLKIDTEWIGTDLWIGKYLRYKTDLWPNPPVEDFLTFVCYAWFKNLPFQLDVFYVLKYDYSGKISGEKGKGNLLSHSIGLQTEGKLFDVIKGGATFVAQTGKYGQDKISALGANAKIGLIIPVPSTPELTAQITWGSGDSNPGDGIHETFDGVFGGRDIYFYGYLSLFFWPNLKDIEFDFSIKPHKTISIFIQYHLFYLDQPKDAWYTTGIKISRIDKNGASGTNLGCETDLRIVWTLWKHLEIMAGFGLFQPGGFVRVTGEAKPASWTFLQGAYSW